MLAWIQRNIRFLVVLQNNNSVNNNNISTNNNNIYSFHQQNDQMHVDEGLIIVYN